MRSCPGLGICVSKEPHLHHLINKWYKKIVWISSCKNNPPTSNWEGSLPTLWGQAAGKSRQLACVGKASKPWDALRPKAPSRAQQGCSVLISNSPNAVWRKNELQTAVYLQNMSLLLLLRSVLPESSSMNKDPKVMKRSRVLIAAGWQSGCEDEAKLVFPVSRY